MVCLPFPNRWFIVVLPTLVVFPKTRVHLPICFPSMDETSKHQGHNFSPLLLCVYAFEFTIELYEFTILDSIVEKTILWITVDSYDFLNFDSIREGVSQNPCAAGASVANSLDSFLFMSRILSETPICLSIIFTIVRNSRPKFSIFTQKSRSVGILVSQ